MIYILHLGDITKINGADAPMVDIITGGSPCQDLSVAGRRQGLAGERSGLFMEQMRIVKEMRNASKEKLMAKYGENYDKTKISPRYMVWENVCTIFDTLVETSNGLKKIGEIQAGELVRTHDGTYHKVVLTHKTEMQPTIKVKYQGGELVCTPNHPILTEDMTYKPACEFKVGDRVGFKVDEPGTKSIGMPIAYAFGRWLADGSIAIRNDRKTKHRIFISTGYKKYESLKAELSKLPWQINEQKMDWAVNFTFSSDEFGELTDSAGYGARNKQVPEWVFDLIAEERDEVLRGYLDGDGYQRVRSENHTECSFTTSSEKLAYGIARLVRAIYHVGVSLSYTEGKGTTIIDGREVNAHGSWHCSFSTPNKYAHNLQGIAGASKYNNGYVWCKIREISEGEIQDVYNLSVEDNNTFTANGIICHNCGAYSSGNPAGSDFAAVLEEIARVVVDEIPNISVPEQGWTYSGCIEGMGDEGVPFSICWRTHDAQYWGKTILDNSGRVVKAGTPQRRRRIALVADFGGQSAPEILFESDSMPGNSKPRRETRETTPGASGTGIEESGTTVTFNETSVNPTVSNAIPIYNHPQGSELSFIEEGVSQTLTARAGTGGNNTPMVFENHGQDTRYTELGDVCTTVSATFGMGGNNTPFVVNNPKTIAIEGNGTRDSHKGDGYSESDVMYTLNTVEQHAVCVSDPTVNILNPDDRQGQQIADSNGVYPTLRGCDGGGYQAGYMLDRTVEQHAVAYGFQGQAGASTGMPVVEEGVPTMVANQVTNVVQPTEPVLLESNQNHATVQTDGVSTTLPASMGEGGGYVPMVVDNNQIKQEGCDLYNLRMTGEVSPTISTMVGNPDGTGGKVLMSNVPTYAVEPGAASRLGGHVTEEIAPTLRAEMGDNQTAVCYGMSSYDSNAMKSPNPNSGIYQADTARTLDLNGGNPACNQGGMMVVQPNEELSNADKEQVEDWVNAVNSSAKHQQDLIQSDLGVAHTIAPGTHASGPHLTKTLVTSAVSDKPIKESVKTYGVVTKGNGDAFIAEERHTSLSTGGGEAGQGYPCALVETQEPICVQRRFSSANVYEGGVVPTLEAGAGEGGNNMPLVMDTPIQDVTGTLGARTYKNSSVQEAETNMFVITPQTTAFAQNQRDEVRDLQDVAGALSAESGIHQQTFVAQTFKKDSHAKNAEDGQGWVSTDVNDTLNAFDQGETRTPTLVVDQPPKTYQDTTGALCASGYEKNGTQEAANDMYVVQEATAWDGSPVSSTLTANNANGAQRMPDKENFNAVIQPQVQCMEVFHCTTDDEVSHPIKARDYKDPQVVAIDMGAEKSDGGEPAVCGIDTYNIQETGEVGRTLTAAGGGLNEHTPCICESQPTYGVSGTSSKFAVGNDTSPTQTAAHPNMVSTTSIVRRLTPLECTRLQGYPDGWVDIGDWVDENGKKHKDSDSPKYKALGNSIALPFWDWMAGRMCAKLRESGVANPTMASLFDGIGGFPLVYSWHGCEPKWASEIESFPIAVTKIRFADGMWKQYIRKEYRK